MAKTCDSCTKKASDRRCVALKKMIGKKQECWAYSDDPEWFQKVTKATVEYIDRKTGEGTNHGQAAV